MMPELTHQLFSGEQVIVEHSQQVGLNDHRQPIHEWVATPVDNVLISPGPSNDIPDTSRPAGIIVAWNLHFPKTYRGSLANAQIRVYGEAALPVLGDPKPYPEHLTPGPWNRLVEVYRADG